ncbi:MAG: hypothetical protein R2829_10040 [Bacteroidia bacterium]
MFIPLILAGRDGRLGAKVLHLGADVTPQIPVAVTQSGPTLLYPAERIH